ncbi:hypothetical protein BY458DRAFT_26782 [Sporodiniella umbellata]|nr:hypothetical protein BY458DRAFT_26782 [Sporodiniella umbellata]
MKRILLSLFYMLYIKIFVSAESITTNRTECDPILALCSPQWNETWYEHTTRIFSRNQKNTAFLNNVCIIIAILIYLRYLFKIFFS